MRRDGTFIFASTLLAIGCNSILENEPGRLVARDGGASSAEPNESSDTSPTEPISGEDSSGTSSGQSSSSGNGSSSGSSSGNGTIDAGADVGTVDAGPPPCAAGFADCNMIAADGCETSLETVNDCGGCGLKCPSPKNVTMACVGGACSGTCTTGFGDCNGKAEDGCEKNLLKDKNNCGACGLHCAFGRCEQGTCVWP